MVFHIFDNHNNSSRVAAFLLHTINDRNLPHTGENVQALLREIDQNMCQLY